MRTLTGPMPAGRDPAHHLDRPTDGGAARPTTPDEPHGRGTDAKTSPAHRSTPPDSGPRSHRTRVHGLAGVPVARRDLTRAAMLWGEPANVRAAIAQAAGELLALAAHGHNLDADLVHTGDTVRITITAQDMSRAPIDRVAAHRMTILTALSCRIHLRRTGTHHTYSCDIPTATRPRH